MTLDVLIEKAMDKNKKEIEERRIREEIRNKKKQVSKLIESYFNKNAFKFKELEIAFPFFNAKLGESLIVFEGYTKNKALFITCKPYLNKSNPSPPFNPISIFNKNLKTSIIHIKILLFIGITNFHNV
jgi:hypothetical protein